MTEYKFTEEEFTEALIRVRDRFGPDHVYVSEERADSHSAMDCYYAHRDGTTGCFIGEILKELGDPVSPENGESADVLLRDKVPDHVRWAAFTAQRRQDETETWGRAAEGYFEALEQGRENV